MPREPRDGLTRRLAGRGLAAHLLLREMLRELPISSRRALVRRALAALAGNGLARQSEAATDEARRALAELLTR